MGTHAYITERCLPRCAESALGNQAVYGSMLPDMISSYILLDPAQAQTVREITHVSGTDAVVRRASVCAETRAFARGWLAHGEVYGADVWAHKTDPLVDRPTRGYVDNKAALLTELTPAAAHFCIETAIDMLVRRNLDPLIGRKVTESARMRDARIVDVLVRACCPPLEPGMLRKAELIFRWTAAGYGDSLNLPAPLDRLAAAAMFSQLAGGYTGRTIPFDAALSALDHAMAVCQPDYERAINETIRRVCSALPEPPGL